MNHKRPRGEGAQQRGTSRGPAIQGVRRGGRRHVQRVAQHLQNRFPCRVVYGGSPAFRAPGVLEAKDRLALTADIDLQRNLCRGFFPSVGPFRSTLGHPLDRPDRLDARLAPFVVAFQLRRVRLGGTCDRRGRNPCRLRHLARVRPAKASSVAWQSCSRLQRRTP